jgi:hypothetical protein
VAEKIVEPGLSGEEIVEIACDHLRDLLKRSGYLRPSDCYQRLEGRIALSLKATDLGRTPKIEIDTVVRTKEVPSEEVPEEVDEIHIEDKPENELRQEAGLPLPVETKDESGRPLMKYAKYARKVRG